MTPNLTAFLALIRQCEVGTTGDNGYKILYGGSTFGSYTQHPNIVVTAGGYTSTAAGAYQVLYRTWLDFLDANGPHDFSPDSQTLCARWLLDRCHATANIEAGRIAEAIKQANGTWASLPGSPYGQPVRDLNWCLSFYQSQGGTLSSYSPTARVSTPTQPTRKTAKDMDPLTAISIFGPLISNLIPQVGKIFGGGERAQQNVAAAQVVLDTVVKAAGAVNEQDAVQKMQDDPAVLQKVTQAVVTEPSILAILEVGGGIQEARKADVIVTQGEKGFWRSPAFYISVVLLVMPFMLLVDVFYVHSDSSYYSENIRTQIVTAVLLIISMVGAFYLGSSQGSQKKDEMLAAKQ